jgi:hypothetical protein
MAILFLAGLYLSNQTEMIATTLLLQGRQQRACKLQIER